MWTVKDSCENHTFTVQTHSREANREGGGGGVCHFQSPEVLIPKHKSRCLLFPLLNAIVSFDLLLCFVILTFKHLHFWAIVVTASQLPTTEWCYSLSEIIKTDKDSNKVGNRNNLTIRMSRSLCSLPVPLHGLSADSITAPALELNLLLIPVYWCNFSLLVVRWPFNS